MTLVAEHGGGGADPVLELVTRPLSHAVRSVLGSCLRREGTRMLNPPASDRPLMPDGYGVPSDTEGLLAWPDVERRLVEAPVYWLATTRPDGRPHVVPRWGVWVEGAFWYDGSPETRHVRNLMENPACSLHLEDGTRAVIAEGTLGPDLGAGARARPRVCRQAFGKYHDEGYAPAADAWDGEGAGGLCRLSLAKALAWSSFPTDVTRFRWS